MKLIFESEDCIVGIGVGLLMIGLSGKWKFTLPELNYLWAVAFFVSFLLTIFDVVHTFSDLSYHPMMLALLVANNVVDGIVEIALTAKYFGFEIPKISALLNPYLAKPEIMFALGIFFLASSVFWLVAMPFVK